MSTLITVIVVLVVLLAVLAPASLTIVKQYEVGVLFRLGRVIGVRAPGLRVIIPFVDVLHRVSLRIVTMPKPLAASASLTWGTTSSNGRTTSMLSA